MVGVITLPLFLLGVRASCCWGRHSHMRETSKMKVITMSGLWLSVRETCFVNATLCEITITPRRNVDFSRHTTPLPRQSAVESVRSHNLRGLAYHYEQCSRTKGTRKKMVGSARTGCYPM